MKSSDSLRTAYCIDCNHFFGTEPTQSPATPSPASRNTLAHPGTPAAQGVFQSTSAPNRLKVTTHRVSARSAEVGSGWNSGTPLGPKPAGGGVSASLCVSGQLRLGCWWRLTFFSLRI